MKIPEDVKEAINEMFLCKNLTEHMACFQHFYKELKDCTFVVFSEDEGTELPEALHSNYDNDFAIINIGSANRYYAVNSEIYREMLRTGRSDYYIDVCVELDTQAVSYLKNIFEEYNQIPDCDAPLPAQRRTTDRRPLRHVPGPCASARWHPRWPGNACRA